MFKRLILSLAAKICYKLAGKIELDLNKNEKNDLLELGDKLTSMVEALKK